MNKLVWLARLAPVILAVLLMVGFIGVSWGAQRPTVTISVILDPSSGDIEALRPWSTSVLSAASGIFDAQVGVELRTAYVDVNHVSDTTQAVQLLYDVQRARSLNAMLYDTCMTLFFTGRNLNIGTVRYAGQASTGSLCRQHAVAVVNISYSFADVEVTAHEIAHVFGAPHDGEQECSDEPPRGFIMQSAGGYAERFSPCSVRVMTSAIAATPRLQSVASDPPPPIQNLQPHGAGSVDDALLGFLLGVAFLLYVQRRR